MIDHLGRKIEYLRISVTQKCNMNCIYCNPDKECESSCDSLSVEDFKNIVKSMAKFGIKKVRLTGGEPLLRNDLCGIIKALSEIEGIEDISATTNGLRLKELAIPLKQAGLNRINISLDSLDEEKFGFITGGGKLKEVLDGIKAVVEAGLSPIKINVVLIKGVNDEEIDTFINLAKDNPIEVRFIELMPIGDFGKNNKEKIIYNSEILKMYPKLNPVESMSFGPAMMYTSVGFKGLIGFISPMSHQFCHLCNRIRLTCDGKIKPCLGENGEIDILTILRNNPERLDEVVEAAVFNKPKGHHFNEEYKSLRSMNKIGG